MNAVLKKILVSLSRIVVGVPVVVLTLSGIALFLLGATLRGQSVGLGAAILGGVLFCAIGYWNHEWFKRIRRPLLAVLLPLAALLYIVPGLLAPNGGAPDARVRNCYLHGQGGFSRWTPGNVVPEIDQLKVGVDLFRLRDIDAAEAGRLQSLILPLYPTMDQDPDFRSVGSAMGAAYRDVLHLGYRTGHYFAIVPKTTGDQRLPCLVFLHGMGGNMKACLWLLSKLSEQNHCIVIAPTFGIGNWDRAGSGKFVDAVVHEAMTAMPIDPKRIFLMGYSNGAMGVTRAAIADPKLYRGLIYLSAVTDDDSASTDQLPKGEQGQRILFLHGAGDRRIPWELVAKASEPLGRRGYKVQLKVFSDDDHYLLFAKPDAVLANIAEFMAAR